MADTKPTRAMQIVSVRFGERQLELIQHEAEAEGVSASQFIRDAAYARAALAAVERKTASARMWVAMLALAREGGTDTLAEALARALNEIQSP